MLNNTFTQLKPIRSAWPSISQTWTKLSDARITQYALAGRYGPEVQNQFQARRKPSKKRDANEGMFE